MKQRVHNVMYSKNSLVCKPFSTLKIQWNLRIMDTLGAGRLSVIGRVSVSWRIRYERFHCIGEPGDKFTPKKEVDMLVYIIIQYSIRHACVGHVVFLEFNKLA